MAGRFGPDWRVAETRSKGLFVEYPPALEVMGSFCAAIQSVFHALAVAMGGFSPSTWTPVHGWAASGGIYSIAVHGDRFVVVETTRSGALTSCATCCRPGSPRGWRRHALSITLTEEGTTRILVNDPTERTAGLVGTGRRGVRSTDADPHRVPGPRAAGRPRPAGWRPRRSEDHCPGGSARSLPATPARPDSQSISASYEARPAPCARVLHELLVRGQRRTGLWLPGQRFWRRDAGLPRWPGPASRQSGAA